MKHVLVPVTADADERALVVKLAAMVRNGLTDRAADSLASHLQKSYNDGWTDGHGEALVTWGEDADR